MRWIVGNLDAETEMARTGGARPGATSEAALRTASALATLLRVFAGGGDVLWTPRPVDPGRIPDVPGLVRPRLSSARMADGKIAFAWAETSPLAARVNHRGFLLGNEAGFPDRLPGIREVRRAADIAGGPGPFVLKAPWSAAGRLRIVGEPHLGAADLERAGRLLYRYGVLIREPWLSRTADFGCSGVIDDAGVEILPPHHLLTDSRGGFRGIRGPLESPILDRIRQAARRAGEVLMAAGYRGRFGIDGLTGIDATGRERPHLPCEINARTTFGHVAAALLSRLGAAGAGFELRIGRGLPDEGVSLLLPGTDDPTEARFLY